MRRRERSPLTGKVEHERKVGKAEGEGTREDQKEEKTGGRKGTAKKTLLHLLKSCNATRAIHTDTRGEKERKEKIWFRKRRKKRLRKQRYPSDH